MQDCKRWSLALLLVFVTGVAAESPAEAYYGHRNYRNYRSGRGYNGGAQRASAAMSAAQMRAYAAQTNLARAMRTAKQKAENSTGLAATKTEHTQAERDYQTSRMSVVENLKKTNPEFSGLLQECQNLRQQIASLAKTGNTTGSDIKALESQLRTKSRHVSLIENEAINADSSVKGVLSRQASTHTAEVAESKEVQKAVSQDPAVKAAQQQLSQANQQAMMAANRYSNSMMGGYGSGGYGNHRHGHRGGYGSGYGYRGSGYRGYRGGYHVHHVRYTHHHRRR